MEKLQLTVKGMSCGHCVKSIETKIGKLGGIIHVKVDLKNAKVDLEYDKSTISSNNIKEAIDELGYEVD